MDFKKKILLNVKGEKVSKAINILRSYVSQKGISEPNSTNNHGYILAIKKYLKGHSELDNTTITGVVTFTEAKTVFMVVTFSL